MACRRHKFGLESIYFYFAGDVAEDRDRAQKLIRRSDRSEQDRDDAFVFQLDLLGE